jgi:hypothetical protein
MNYDPSAKLSSLQSAMTEAKNCPVAPVEQIASKCHGILEMSVIIESTAEIIRGKLFSPQPQCEEKRPEPYSIDSVLDCIRGVLNSAIKTLQEINERT